MTTQKSKVIFETFNDGVCSVCEIDEDGNAGKGKVAIRFQERTVGIKRYYEAMTNKVQIDRLIRIHWQSWMSTEYMVIIDGKTYEIVQVQTIPDALPKCNDVSLRLVRQRR